jgi:hypothetical protein
LIEHSQRKKKPEGYTDESPRRSRIITGKELDELEELNIKLETLVGLLSEKKIVSKREYASIVAMRLHEISKAKSFEELDEEI